MNLLHCIKPDVKSKTGWPWTVGSAPFPKRMPDGSPWPKISIVTPSYNQGKFIEETIRSVLLQNYPNLEYIIIDGGSTDGSVEIIKKYEQWLTYWESEQDRGQSHAINKGWAKATGDVISYLNSDDIYLPNALRIVAEKFIMNNEYSIFTGAIGSTDSNSVIKNIRNPYLQYTTPVDLTLLDHEKWFIPQSSSFFTKILLDNIGRFVREDLHYTMDRELIYRAVKNGKLFIIENALSTYRHHPNCKTTANILESYEENRKAFSYCQWGKKKQFRRRKKVLRWRIALGYWRQGRIETSFIKINKYFFLAAIYKPDYLLRKKFIKTYIKKLIHYED